MMTPPMKSSVQAMISPGRKRNLLAVVVVGADAVVMSAVPQNPELSHGNGEQDQE
ncbi:hypothetical protein D3C87_2163430 [compost metagenome]